MSCLHLSVVITNQSVRPYQHHSWLLFSLTLKVQICPTLLLFVNLYTNTLRDGTCSTKTLQSTPYTRNLYRPPYPCPHIKKLMVSKFVGGFTHKCTHSRANTHTRVHALTHVHVSDSRLQYLLLCLVTPSRVTGTRPVYDSLMTTPFYPKRKGDLDPHKHVWSVGRFVERSRS